MDYHDPVYTEYDLPPIAPGSAGYHDPVYTPQDLPPGAPADDNARIGKIAIVIGIVIGLFW